MSEAQSHPKIVADIEKDVGRSFVGNEQYLFLKPRLEKMLLLIGKTPIEYAQGMNFIVLYLLIFCLEAEAGECAQDAREEAGELASDSIEWERSFLSIALHVVNSLSDIYSSDPRGMVDTVKELEYLITENEPQVLYHIGKTGFESMAMFSSHYYSLMMVAKPPHLLAKRILDTYLLEGRAAIHSLLVKMLHLCSEHLLLIHDPMALQKMINYDMVHLCADRLIAL